MKTFFLSSIAIMLISFSSMAQICKYEVNGVDRFTGKLTKITKPKTVMVSFYTGGEFYIKMIDTNYYFVLNYTLSSYADFENYSINKGAKIMFLLEDESIITLSSYDNINGSKSVVFGLPPVYECRLNNVCYPISYNDIKKFYSRVKSIRFYRNESNGKEDYIDYEIKERNKDDIRDLINCVL